VAVQEQVHFNDLPVREVLSAGASDAIIVAQHFKQFVFLIDRHEVWA
jgi:hypothetical protein